MTDGDKVMAMATAKADLNRGCINDGSFADCLLVADASRLSP